MQQPDRWMARRMSAEKPAVSRDHGAVELNGECQINAIPKRHVTLQRQIQRTSEELLCFEQHWSRLFEQVKRLPRLPVKDLLAPATLGRRASELREQQIGSHQKHLARVILFQ